MTRTGQSPRLAAHLPEPFVEVHPQDAVAMQLDDQGFARVITAHGACILKVVVSANQQPGSLFVPIHWSTQTASGACAGDLVAGETDPYSGQPEAKATPAAIAPVHFKLRGVARSRGALNLPAGTWWARLATADGSEYRFATDLGPMSWHDFAFRELAADTKLAEELDGRRYRAAAFLDDSLDACLWVGPAQDLPHWTLDGLVPPEASEEGAPPILKKQISEYYMGRGEAIVCACFQVGLETVRQAVASGASRSVEDIGRALGAGTNCGSCLPELKRIVVHGRIAHPV
jgi:assimilatory nitrate reductase catalytic subunit